MAIEGRGKIRDNSYDIVEGNNANETVVGQQKWSGHKRTRSRGVMHITTPVSVSRETQDWSYHDACGYSGVQARRELNIHMMSRKASRSYRW